MENKDYNYKERYEYLKATAAQVVELLEEKKFGLAHRELEPFLQLLKTELEFKLNFLGEKWNSVAEKTVAKKLCLANGDEFDQAEFELDSENLAKFIPIKTEGKTIFVNPDFIISFASGIRLFRQKT